MAVDYFGKIISVDDRVVFIDIHNPTVFSRGIVEDIESDGWVDISYKDPEIGVRRRISVPPFRIIRERGR